LRKCFFVIIQLTSTKYGVIYTHTHLFYGPLDFVRDCPGELVPEPMCILLKQETVSGSGISWDICKSAPRHRQINMPATQPTGNSIKTLKACEYKPTVIDEHHYFHISHNPSLCITVNRQLRILLKFLPKIAVPLEKIGEGPQNQDYVIEKHLCNIQGGRKKTAHYILLFVWR